VLSTAHIRLGKYVMFKILLMLATTTPLVAITTQAFDINQPQNENSINARHEAVAAVKLENLAACVSTDMYIAFHDLYLEMHASEYLASGVKAISSCNLDAIEISQLLPTKITKKDAQFASDRAEELKATLNSYYPNYDIIVTEKYVDWTAYVTQSRPLKVSFSVSQTAYSDSQF